MRLCKDYNPAALEQAQTNALEQAQTNADGIVLDQTEDVEASAVGSMDLTSDDHEAQIFEEERKGAWHWTADDFQRLMNHLH